MLRLLLVVLAIGGLALMLSACDDTPQPQTPVESVKIIVRDTGLYQVQIEDLQEAGFPLSAVADGSLQLTQDGEEVPYYLEEEAIVFYGLASSSRYTGERVYILIAGENGVQMATQSADPSGMPTLSTIQRSRRLEQNLDYASETMAAGDVSDPWFWRTIGLQENEPIEFDLEAVSSGAGQLSANLVGVSHSAAVDPDHNLRLVVNDVEIVSFSWEGQTAYTATVGLPAETLKTVANTIRIESVHNDFLDVSKLDWIEIRYDSRPIAENGYLAFSAGAGAIAIEGFTERPIFVDVSNPAAPSVLSGWSYEAGVTTLGLERHGAFVGATTQGFLKPERIEPMRKSDWDSPRQQADLLIVTTGELRPALEPLVAARRNEGLSVALVPVEELYDAFGHGTTTPESINRFVAFAYQHWQRPAPRYLLLVGDATVDYRGYLSRKPDGAVEAPRNVIPPYLVPVSFGGETVSDARLADVEGDRRPELAVGRWPVDSVAQVESLVQRTLAYEQSPAAERAIFTVDGSSGEFERLAERIVSTNSLPGESHMLVGPTVDVLTSSWQEGAWLVTYVGHGSLQLWAKDGMLSSDAVNALVMKDVSPIVLQLTCLTALFAHPSITSLSEVMVTHRNGPALVIGATSLTLSVHQEPFAAALVASLQDPSVARIGDALQRARQVLDVSRTGPGEISDTFVLLGDPSAQVVRPLEGS